MNVVGVMAHVVVGLDANGTLCACGTHAADYLEHLADVALAAMGTTRPSRSPMPVVALIVQPPCSGGDCDRDLYARGLCVKHYQHEYHLNRERRAA